MTRFAFAAVLFTAFTSTLVQGQTINLRASIPFEFRVGQIPMPAGDYVIQRQGMGPVIVQELSGRHVAMAAFSLAEHSLSTLPKAELEFNRYGETYFLAKLRTPGSQGIVLPKSRRETELAREIGLAQQASIALDRK